MKMLTACCAIALLIASSPVAWAQDSDTSAAERDPQAQDKAAAKHDRSPVDAIRDFSVERRAEAVAAAKRATDELDSQMERLQEQMSEGWSRMSAATRQRSQEEMADLRARRNTLAEWVGGMQHGSASAWTEVKTGFAKSYDELATALRKARDGFRQPRAEPAGTSEEPAEKKDG